MIKKNKDGSRKSGQERDVPVGILGVLLLDGGQTSLGPCRGFAEENLEIEKIYK